MKKEYDLSQAKRGAVVPPSGKTRITIYIDDEILQAFRDRAEASSTGYQTLINQVLSEYVGKSDRPLDESMLRRVIREELHAVG